MTRRGKEIGGEMRLGKMQADDDLKACKCGAWYCQSCPINMHQVLASLERNDSNMRMTKAVLEEFCVHPRRLGVCTQKDTKLRCDARKYARPVLWSRQ